MQKKILALTLALMTWIIMSAVTSAAEAATIAEGDYCILPAGNTNYAVDVQGGGQAAQGTQLWIFSKNNTDAQIFTIKHVSGAWYKIIHKRTGYLINVQGGNLENDARLWLYPDDGTASCYWRFLDAGNGNYMIQSQLNTHRVFDLHNNNAYDGALLHLYDFHNGTSAKWKLVRVTASPQPQPQPSGLLYPLKGKSIINSSNTKTKGIKCDYQAEQGTAIYAPTDGTVAFRQSYAINYKKLASYGNNIVFTSSDGQYKITIAHLSSFNGVSLRFAQSLSYPCSASKYKCTTITLATKNVRKGDLLGYTGMTGNASGPHMHIEVSKNGTPVDPKSVFTTW